MQQVFVTPQCNNKNFNKNNEAEQEYHTSSSDIQENIYSLLIITT